MSDLITFDWICPQCGAIHKDWEWEEFDLEAATSGCSMLCESCGVKTMMVYSPQTNTFWPWKTFSCELSNPWYIAPLDGKYYGTKVCYNPEGTGKHLPCDVTHEVVLTIWQPDHFAVPFASEREIARGWTNAEEGHDHVEDQQSFKLACFLMSSLNNASIRLAPE